MDARPEPHRPPAPLAQAIGRTRFVVLLAVAAVLLVAVALFVFGAVLAVLGVWNALHAALRGELGSADLTVEFLEIVSVMLKAVVFYLVGVGLFGSLGLLGSGLIGVGTAPTSGEYTMELTGPIKKEPVVLSFRPASG